EVARLEPHQLDLPPRLAALRADELPLADDVHRAPRLTLAEHRGPGLEAALREHPDDALERRRVEPAAERRLLEESAASLGLVHAVRVPDGAVTAPTRTGRGTGSPARAAASRRGGAPWRPPRAPGRARRR